jgi:ketosteroid isomerase-like protein
VPTEEQVHAAIERYAAAVSSAAKDQIMACYADGACVQDPYPQPRHEGKDGVSTFWDGVLAMGSPCAFLPRDVVVTADRGVFYFTIHVDLGEGDGKVRLEVGGYDILTIDDEGLIVDQLAYWNPASMHPIPID